MAWIRPRYWKILEQHGTDLDLPKSVEPYMYSQKRSQLQEWINKAKKGKVPYAIAQYGAMEEGQKEPMRVFGLFIYPLMSLNTMLSAPTEDLSKTLEPHVQKESLTDGE